MIDTSLAGASGVSPGGGGGGTATLAEQEAQTALLTTLAETVVTSAPGPADPVIAVRNVQEMAVAPGVVPPGTDAQSMYLIQAGTGEPVLDANNDQRLGVVVVDPVRQGAGDRGLPWYVATTPDGVTQEQVATAAKQDATNGHLTDIKAQLPPALGPQLEADSLSATIVSQVAYPDAPTETTLAAIQTDTGNVSTASTNIDAKTPDLGQATMVGSTPVVIASDQSPVAVSGPLTDAELRLSPVPVSGTFWQATQPVSGSVTADTELSAPAALADGTANPTVTSLGVFLQGYNGTTWDRILTQNSRLVVSGNVANGATAARPVTCGGVDTGGLSYPFVGAVVGSAIHQFVRASDGSGNQLALASTQTNGTQIAIAKGPISVGAAVGSEKPVLVGGTDGGANARTLLLDTGGVAYSNIRVALADVSHTNPVPTLAARSTHPTVGTTLPAAATTHTLSLSAGTLRRLEWRYTGAGTKYIVICDQAGGTASAANWTKWYRAMSNGAGLSFFEWPEGLRCASGIVLGVSATEPANNVAITLSTNANENFYPVFWSIQP